MTLLDNQQAIKQDVKREINKDVITQITVDINGNQKNYNICGENVEDCVADFKRHVYDTENLMPDKHYQITQLAGGYLTIDYTTKFKSKKAAYQTIKNLFNREEKQKLVKDLQAELKAKK